MPTLAAKALTAAKGQFQAALRDWYRREARPLPWRAEPSLYKTVVSEFMLQQTQVRTVLPYFARWIEELPGFQALAAAEPARVLRLWEGLGYYSRARNLHRLARTIAALAEPPRTPEAWRELPGVGPYTAAAVTSIAFGFRAACVDGNVVRILSRLTADRTAFRDGGTAAKALAPLAQDLVPESDPGDHNQAMMELGATVCLRANPRCAACPVRGFCAAARRGDPEAYPRLESKGTELRTVCRVWCERRGALLLHRGAPGARRLAGLHELPTAEQAGIAPKEAKRGRLLATGKRGIARTRITEEIHESAPPRGRLPAGLVWVPPGLLDTLTLSGPHRRWVRAILARPGAPRSAPSTGEPPRASPGGPARSSAGARGARIRSPS